MASSINFGNLSQNGNSFRLSGSSSKLDTEQLVEALATAKRLPAARLEQKIVRNDAKVAAYQDLKTRLTALKDSVASLRNPPGFLGVQDNLFENKEVFYSSSTTTAPTSLLAVSAENGAAAGSFNLEVEQLATARKFMSASMTAPGTELEEQLGSFSNTLSLAVEGKEPVSLTIDSSMSLNDLRAAINTRSKDTGISANVIKERDDSWRLVVTAKETGKEVLVSQGEGDDVLATLGISADGGTTFVHGLQDPLDAKIKIDGVSITRDTNKITDAIEGMTFDLYRAEAGTTITVEVEQSVGAVKEQIATFVNAFNEVRAFVEAQSIPPDTTGDPADRPVLFGDTTLRTVQYGLGGLIGGQVTGLDDAALSSLGELGIRLDETNRLTVDDAKLDKALLTRLDEVRDVFEFSFQSSSAELSLFNRPDTLTTNAFTVSIVDEDEDGFADQASIGDIVLEIDGKRLKGPDGSELEGLEFLWTGSGSQDIEVEATQGLADKLFNYLDKITMIDEGMVDRASSSLEDRTIDYRDEIAKIEERVTAFRDLLIQRYAAMESALTLTNNMLQQVKAQADAMNGSSS